jgi:hypothetical protein
VVVLKKKIIEKSHAWADFIKAEDLRREKEYSDPVNSEKREMLKQMWEGDIDGLAHFAVMVMKEAAITERKNEELSKILNELIGYIHFFADGGSPDINIQIAKMLANTDPENIVSKMFFGAISTGRIFDYRKNAYKGHSKKFDAKQFVYDEWQKHEIQYESNKSAFARDYSRIVAKDFGVKVTERQIREVWLKSNPSASKPYSLPANREQESK